MTLSYPWHIQGTIVHPPTTHHPPVLASSTSERISATGLVLQEGACGSLGGRKLVASQSVSQPVNQRVILSDCDEQWEGTVGQMGIEMTIHLSV